MGKIAVDIRHVDIKSYSARPDNDVVAKQPHPELSDGGRFTFTEKDLKGSALSHVVEYVDLMP